MPVASMQARLSWGSLRRGYLREHLGLTLDYQRTLKARKRISDGFVQQTRNLLDRRRRDLVAQQNALVRAHFAAHVMSKVGEADEEIRKFCAMTHHARNQTIAGRMMRGISFATLIQTFPLWVGQMRHLGVFLPFEANLFDLVVVDESSQVNIAEIVPAFYRGSRICVVGDDKQLGLNAAGVNFGFGVQFEELIWTRHFAGSGVLYSQADHRNLLVRKHSILEFIRSLQEGKAPKTTLDEHFRSLPQLASFTNETFYKPHGEALRLMKEVPTNFHLECFDSRKVGGTRDPNFKLVQAEIDEVLLWLEKFMLRRHFEQDPLRAHGFPHEPPPSLGVISFLREQRNAILDAVTDKFSKSDIETFRLLVGTPEEFQGNERDIVLITLGLDGSETRVNFWNEPRRFNVATSRAIHYTLLIYGGLPKGAHLVRSYLRHFGKAFAATGEEEEGHPTVHAYRWVWNRPLHRQRCESKFEHLIADFLEEFVEQHGGHERIRLSNQVEATDELGVHSCGKRLDFVMLNTDNGTSVAVEVDGRQHFGLDGRSYSEEHLERVEVLRRAGWNIVHVPYYRWWRNGWLGDGADPQFQATVRELFADLRCALALP
jgi:hypothetical protein